MARQVLDNGVILPSEYSDDWYDDMTSNLTKLDEVIGSDAEKLSASDVGAAALSNSYDDLDDKPAYNILRRASVTLTAGGTGNYSDLDSDSKIKTGDYVLDAANKLYSITAIDAANSTYTVSAAALITFTDKSELGAAALSNSYDDLSNLPGYGILRFCSTAITDNYSVPFANISSVSKIAAGDFLLDTAAKLYTISAVDTVNQTVSVTTPLTQLAIDADVVHKTGDETIGGRKTFSDNLTIYNSDSATAIAGLILKNQKAERGGGLSESQVVYFTDKLTRTLATLRSQVGSNGQSILVFRSDNVDSNNNNVYSGLSINSYKDGSKNMTPYSNGDTDFGTATLKWKSFNGLEPSALSLPSDRDSRINILGSFINTGSGQSNTYTAIANGYIYLGLANCGNVFCTCLNSQNQIIYRQSFVRSGDGSVYILFPITKNNIFKCEWYTGSTITVNDAFFIPCQGNI